MSPALTPVSTIPTAAGTVTPLYTAFSFTHRFEELSLFWQYSDATAWRAGRIDGQFEVAVDRAGDWIITEVAICVDNGKIGAEAKGHLMPLDADADERFYLLLLDAIDHQYASYIDERIAEEAAERGIRIAA